MWTRGLFRSSGNRDLSGVSLMILLLLAVLFSFSMVSAAEPNGANVTASEPQRTPTNYTARSALAYAGNVTELTVFGYSPTQSWQGYFGNVTGTIQLADSQSRIMYNWTLASPQGEIYASTNSSILWSRIQCFNFTAEGTLDQLLSEVAGETNLYGTNYSQLESTYGINVTQGVDGVDETFVYPTAGSGHDQFFTASQQFDAQECMSTRIFDSSGTGVDGFFEEVLLYEPTSTSVIFASLLDEDQPGFDGATHDFEMLVLENGHGTDVSTTTYYFFVEIA